MDSRKQNKTKVLRYGLVAFRDNLSCQIFNISDINGPRRKVTGASVKIDINGGFKRGTIISVADQKKCLQIEKEKLNVAKFFGLPNRKKATPVVPLAPVPSVPIVSLPVPTQHVTRSSTKRKLETVKEQSTQVLKPSTTSKRRRLSKIPVRAAIRQSSSRKLRSKCCSHCKVPLSYRRPSCSSYKHGQYSFTDHSPESIVPNISTKFGITASDSLPNPNHQTHVKTVAERADKDHPHTHPSPRVSDKTITKDHPHTTNHLHVRADTIQSSSTQGNPDPSTTNLKLYWTIDQTGITEHSPFIKQESKDVSFLDLPVFTPAPDCLSPIPPVEPHSPSSKPSSPPKGLIPGLKSQISPPSMNVPSPTIKPAPFTGPKLTNDSQQPTSVNVLSPSLGPLISNTEEYCSSITSEMQQLVNPPPVHIPAPIQSLQQPVSLVKGTPSPPTDAHIPHRLLSMLSLDPVAKSPSAKEPTPECLPIVNDPILPAYTPTPGFISPIPSVEQLSPIRPALPSPIHTSSPLKTDLVGAAKTSFSSPLDRHRSLDFSSPMVVDPSTPSYLALESSTSTTEPLTRSFAYRTIPIDFDSPMLIDPPTPDDVINSSSSYVDYGSSSMSGCVPLSISPPENLPIPESPTHISEVNVHSTPFPHTKISMTHNTTSMSGIEPLLQSFSEYPTPDQDFVDPERDPITNHLLISGPMKTRLDRARHPNISKARRSLQFTVTDPCLAEKNISFNNPQQIPLPTTDCSNRNKSICAEDRPILNWIKTAQPPPQWMHKELERDAQRTDQQEHYSSTRFTTPISSRINEDLTSPGWHYFSPNEDQMKLFADEDSESVSSLSPIVTASTNTPTSNPQIISRTPSQLVINNRRHSSTSHAMPDFLQHQTNHMSANVSTNTANPLSTFFGHTMYPAQPTQNDVSPMYSPIIAVQQTSNYLPFTETSVKHLPNRPPLQMTLPQFTIQAPFYQPASGFPSRQCNTPSNQQACFYTPVPQFQFTAPVQTFPPQTPMSNTPNYIHPQAYTAAHSVYLPFHSESIVQIPPRFYGTPPTSAQIFPRAVSYHSRPSTATPKQQLAPKRKKPIPTTETITASINATRESQKTIYDSSSTMTPVSSKVPNSENDKQTSSSSSQTQETHLIQKSYQTSLQPSSSCTVSQSGPHTQEQHGEFYHKIGRSSPSFSQDSQLNTPTTLSRPDPCPTPLPQLDSYTKTTVTVVKKSAKDVEIVRQLKYFDIDDHKLLRLKAAHVAKRYITSQYVQYVLDDLPEDADDEPVPYPFMIDTEILREALSTNSASPQQFARFLFDELFTVAEFRDHSVSGGVGRRILNQSKMASIKVAVSTIFPMENNEWQRCESSINSHIKVLERKMKRLTWLKFDNYQS